MASTVEMSASWNALSDVITRIRHRWRLRLALHGLTIVLAAALLAWVVGAWVMQLFHFAPPAVLGVRVVAYAALVALAVRYIVLPLRRTPRDTQVALYLEEHERSLDAVVVSAVEAGTVETSPLARSPHLVGRLMDMAAARATAVGNGGGLETRDITTSLLTLLGIVLAAALLLLMGPEFLRTSARLLAAPRSKAALHVFIAVQPGDAKVSRGGSQAIQARLHGFAGAQAELVMQHDNGKWDRLPMSLARDSASFVVRLFDLRERTTYYVEANGVRSPTYHLDIVNLPAVKQLTLQYHFPTYTGLADKTEHGGDITAPEGTSVTIHATTTMPVTGARLAIAGQTPIPMTLGPDGVLTGKIPVTAPGFYKVELQAANGNFMPGSLDYTIDVVKDNDPEISFVKPGRDVGVPPTEDVVTEVKATDDYGVAKVEIRYSVNGGPEQVLAVHTGPARQEVTADHTFSLKQLNLEAGDVVSYYAQATDNDGIHGGKTAKTDMYFVNVRERGDKGGQQQQSQKGGEQPTVLARKQREIIAGTFKVERDGAHVPALTRRENLTTLAQSQNWLRGRIDQLAQKIEDRGLPEQYHEFQNIVDELGKSSQEMQGAEGKLNEPNTQDALGHEQRALQHIQRADAIWRRMKQQQQQQQQQQQPRKGKPQKPDDRLDDPDSTDLANLFDPKQEQLSQQYETAKKTAQDSTVDKLAEKLRQLAMRQEKQEEQQQQQRAGQQQNGQKQNGQQQSGQQQSGQQQSGQQQSGQQSAQEQQQLAKATEQLAKQLEQQAKGNRALQQTAQQLRDAAKDMQQAAMRKDLQAAMRALEKLNQARQRLAQSQQQDAGKGDAHQQLLARAHDLVDNAESLKDQLHQAQQQQQQTAGHNQQSRQGQQKGQQPGQGQQAGPGSKPGPGQQPGQGQQAIPGGQPGERPGRQGPPGTGTQGGGQPSFTRAVSEQLQTAESLQRAVQGERLDAKGLGQAIEQMRELQSQAASGSPASIARAENSILEGLKTWEYGLRKQLAAENMERPLLGRLDDVPAAYRDLVSQYYRSLAKKP